MEQIHWTRKKVFNLLIVILCAGLFLGKLPWVFSAFGQIPYLEYSDAEPGDSLVFDGQVTDLYLDRGVAAGFALKESVAIRVAEGHAEPREIVLLDKDGRNLAVLSPTRESDEMGRSNLRLKIPSFTGAGLSGAERIRFYAEDEEPYPADSIAGLRVYGGSRDILAIVWAILEEVLLLALLIYALRKDRAGESLLAKNWFLAALLAVLSFSIRYVLTTNLVPMGTDERDILLAGFVQKGGGVLYRDYVTLHMPAAYWLAGLYARLGAVTLTHFRLFFQATQSVIWSLVFFRHKGSGLRYAAALFSLVGGPVSYFLLSESAFYILSDVVAATAMGILFLELSAYTKDHRLRPGRLCVLSACIFFAVQSAILTVFPIIAVLFFFIAEELRFSRMRPRRPPVGYYRRRYLWALGIILLPFVVLLLIRLVTGSLGDSAYQTLSFSTGVYAGYIGLSQNPFYFLVSGFGNIMGVFTSLFSTNAAVFAPQLLECLLLLAAFVGILFSGKKYGLPRAICLLLLFETLAARSAVRFHSLMLWTVVLLFLITRVPAFSAGEEIVPVRRKRGQRGSSEDSVRKRGQRGSSEDSVRKREQRGSSEDSVRMREQRESGEDSVQRRRTPGIPATKKSILAASLSAAAFLLLFGIPYLQMSLRSLAAGPAKASAAELAAVRKTEAGKSVFLDANVLTTCYVPARGRLPVNRAAFVLPWYWEVYGEEMTKKLRESLPEVMLYRMGPSVWEYSGFSASLDAACEELYEPGGQDGLWIRRAAAATFAE